MPIRMLRDWTDSDKVNLLSVHAERFFVRLIMKVDDYGCFFADTRLLKASLFPLILDGVREADISRWMTECQKAGLIVLYEATGKRYLQIQDFRQRLDKARNKYPLPNSTDFREVVNDFPAETENEIENENRVGAPMAPRGPDKEGGKEKKKFVAPSLEEVFRYLLSTIGAPDHRRHWAEDKCRNQAALFIDHYTANGWVQGRGKPIKDWQAACRNWIRHELQGDFKPPEPAKREPSAPPRRDAVRDLPEASPMEGELNAMYEMWLENPNNVTIISATADHYNYLKSKGRISFGQQEVAGIHALVQKQMTAKQLEGDAVQKRLLKSYAVLEFFKQLKVQGKGTVFEL